MDRRPPARGQPPRQRRRVDETNDGDDGDNGDKVADLNAPIISALASGNIQKLTAAINLIDEGSYDINGINDIFGAAIDGLVKNRSMLYDLDAITFIKRLLTAGAAPNSPTTNVPKDKYLLASELERLVASSRPVRGGLQSVFYDPAWGPWPQELLNQMTASLYSTVRSVAQKLDYSDNDVKDSDRNAKIISAIASGNRDKLAAALKRVSEERYGIDGLNDIFIAVIDEIVKDRYGQYSDYNYDSILGSILTHLLSHGCMYHASMPTNVPMNKYLLVSGFERLLGRSRPIPTSMQRIFTDDRCGLWPRDLLYEMVASPYFPVSLLAQRKGADLTATVPYSIGSQTFHTSLLEREVRRGNVSRVKALLERLSEGFFLRPRNVYRRYEFKKEFAHILADYNHLLEIAIGNGDQPMVDFLVGNGAKITKAHLEQARQTKRDDIVQILSSGWDKQLDNIRRHAHSDISDDGSRFGSVEAQNAQCTDPLDPIWGTLIPSYAKIRTVTRDSSSGYAMDIYHCFDVRALNEYVNLLHQYHNPLTRGVFSHHDRAIIRQRAAAVESEFGRLEINYQNVYDTEEQADMQQRIVEGQTFEEHRAAGGAARLQRPRNDTSTVMRQQPELNQSVGSCANQVDPVTRTDVEDISRDHLVHVLAPLNDNPDVMREVCYDTEGLAYAFDTGDYFNVDPAVNQSSFSDEEQRFVRQVQQMGYPAAFAEYVREQGHRHLT